MFVFFFALLGATFHSVFEASISDNAGEFGGTFGGDAVGWTGAGFGIRIRTRTGIGFVGGCELWREWGERR